MYVDLRMMSSVWKERYTMDDRMEEEGECRVGRVDWVKSKPMLQRSFSSELEFFPWKSPTHFTQSCALPPLGFLFLEHSNSATTHATWAVQIS